MNCKVLLSFAALSLGAVSYAGTSVPQAGGPENTKAAAEELMVEWADALLNMQVNDTGCVWLDGNFLCPADKTMHGRTIEDVWPLVWLWDRTGDDKYLEAAEGLVRWGACNQQTSEGSYRNDPKSSWIGITIFTQTAIGRTLTRFGDKIPVEFKASLEELYKAQTEYIRIWINVPDLGVNVNYRAAYPLAMEIAARYYSNPLYHEEAARQAAKVRGCIAGDGQFFGEADPLQAVSARGYRGVDVGYNMEESLPAMLEYAELAGDEALLGEMLECARTHLWFFLGDGGIDDSFGSRAYKWSYWGSRTSDGVLPMLSVMARHGSAEAVTAAGRTLEMYRRLTGEDGLLAGGLQFAEAGEPCCIHHTFCHLKTLPLWIDTDFASAPRSGEPLPADKAFGVKYLPTNGVYLVGTDKWRATVSGNDLYLHGDDGKSTGGGSLTLLYHRQIGPVTAASMAQYSLVEKNNMQETYVDRTVRCHTPRIEAGKYKSVYDDMVELSVSGDAHGVTAVAKGVLTDIHDDRGGGEFCLSYSFGGDCVTVDAVSKQDGEYVLPVICHPSDDISVEGNCATVRRGDSIITIKSSSPVGKELTGRPDNLSFNPVGGFLAAVFKVRLSGGVPVRIELSVEAARGGRR